MPTMHTTITCCCCHYYRYHRLPFLLPLPPPCLPAYPFCLLFAIYHYLPRPAACPHLPGMGRRPVGGGTTHTTHTRTWRLPIFHTPCVNTACPVPYLHGGYMPAMLGSFLPHTTTYPVPASMPLYILPDSLEPPHYCCARSPYSPCHHDFGLFSDSLLF